MYQEVSDILRISNADTLRQMLAQCEDERMRMATYCENCYYWPRDVEERVKEELGMRACILNHMFALHCTPAEVMRFETVNAALLRLERMHRSWHDKLQKQFSAIHGLDGEPFTVRTVINGGIDENTPLYVMDEDAYYGSRWREMIDAISETSVIEAMCDSCVEMEDDVSWAEGPLCIPQLEHVKVCYLFHALCTHLDYSIPDVLRMQTYRFDYSMDCTDFVTLDTE